MVARLRAWWIARCAARAKKLAEQQERFRAEAERYRQHMEARYARLASAGGCLLCFGKGTICTDMEIGLFRTCGRCRGSGLYAGNQSVRL